MSDDAKVPRFSMSMEDMEGKIIHPDWTLVVSNQITLITQQSAMLENEKQMIEELRKISAPYEKIVSHQEDQISALNSMVNAIEARRMQWEVMTKNQETMNAGMQALNVMMDKAIEQLGSSVTRASGVVNSLMKIPIAVVVMTAASFAFLYMHEINETTWLVIMGIAVFPWLGDSIEAMMKLVGIRQGPKNGTTKQ